MVNQEIKELLVNVVDFLLNLKSVVSTKTFGKVQDTLSYSSWFEPFHFDGLPPKSTVQLTKLQEKVSELCKYNKGLSRGVPQLCKSIDTVERLLWAVQGDQKLFEKVLSALHFDNPELSQTEVTANVEKAISDLDVNTQLEVKRVLLEETIINDLGFDTNDLSEAYQIIDDLPLYLSTLELLVAQIQNNVTFENTFCQILQLVQLHKPRVYENLEKYLWFHHAKKSSEDPNEWYKSYCSYMFQLEEPTLNCSSNFTPTALDLNEGFTNLHL